MEATTLIKKLEPKTGPIFEIKKIETKPGLIC